MCLYFEMAILNRALKLPKNTKSSNPRFVYKAAQYRIMSSSNEGRICMSNRNDINIFSI